MLASLTSFASCSAGDVDEEPPADADAGTSFEFCHDLSVADCDVVGCSRVRGVLEDDHCGERGADDVLLACIPAPTTCAAVVTCAVRPDDGARFIFSDACIPRDWQQCTPCEGFEVCETELSEPDVCLDETASCDAFLATWNERANEVARATNTCAVDLDCTTEVVRFLCGTGEVFVQGCAIPIAHDLACEYRQAIEDLELELCTAACVPPDCGLVAQCPGPTPVACVDGRCAFVP